MKHLRAPIWLVFALVFGGLVTLTAGVIGARLFYSGFANTTVYIRDRGDAALTALGETVREQLNPAEEESRFISGYILSGKVSIDDDRRIADLLLGSLAASPQLIAVAFVRSDLHVVSAARNVNGEPYETAAEDLLRNPMFRLALRTGSTMHEPAWVPPVYEAYLHETGLPYITPLRRNGEVIGVIAALISPQTVARHVLAGSDTPEARKFVLLNDNSVLVDWTLAAGKFKASEDAPLPKVADLPNSLLQGFDPKQVDKAARFLSAKANFEIREGIGPAEDYFFLYRSMPISGNAPWTAVIAVPNTLVTEVYADLFKALTVSLGALGIAILGGIGLGWLIARPIHSYVRAARHLSALDFAHAPMLGRSRLREFDMAAEAYNGMRSGLSWLSTYVPRSLVPVLMRPESAKSFTSREREVTVMFTDIVGFTAIGRRLSAPALARFLNRHFALLGAAIDAEGGTIDKYIGDSVMSFWGAPAPQADHAERAIRAALEIARRMQSDNYRRHLKGFNPVRMRIGIHSGLAVAGNIGAPGRINYTLVGDTVNIAQRLEQFGKQIDDGKADVIITVSQVVADRLPAEIPHTPLGTHRVIERDDAIALYRLDLSAPAAAPSSAETGQPVMPPQG